MQNQFAMILAAMLGLTQCTEEFETEKAESEPTAELAGTWMEVRTTNDSDGNWESTWRSTVIVEKQGEQVIFRDCIDNTALTAEVVGQRVTLPSADYPVMQLRGGNRLVPVGNDSSVELRRLDASSQAVLADFFMDQPTANADWTSLCLQTLVSDTQPNQLGFRASNSLMGAVVGMTFTMADPIADGQYEYPDADNSISGTFAITGLADGTLSNPVGTVVISTGSTLELQADLDMDNSATGGDIGLSGLLRVNADWFEAN